MPPAGRWINTVDPLAYALDALLPLHLTCDGGAAAGCPTIVYPVPGIGPIPVDRTALVDELYDVSYSHLWHNIGIMAIFAAVLLATSCLSISLLRHITR
jgi:ABC-type multidrug transport system permease subunit